MTWVKEANAISGNTAVGPAWRHEWKRSTPACERSGTARLLAQTTPLIIAYNEAPNIRRTLDKLAWARRIVVIDSGSTDGTVEMLQCYQQVEVIRHPFADFASQCN